MSFRRSATFLAALFLPSLGQAKFPKNYILPDIINGTAPVPIETTVGSGAYDRAYIPSHNASTYEWWYFDAVSSDGQSSVVFVALVVPTALGQGTEVSAQVITPDGEIFANRTDYGPEGKFWVSTRGDGSSGVIGDGDFTWVGQPDLSQYELKVDLPEQDISGTVTLISAASPFVGCDPFGPDARTHTFWWFNWINFMGDAVAVVDLKVGDKRVAFTGNGYHDKNWGPVPYPPHLNYWYWGHGRAGDYSLVWSRVVAKDNTTISGAWLARDGQVLRSTCVHDESIHVEPFGNNVTIPPNRPNDTENIDGFDITINIGEEGLYQFRFDSNRWTNGNDGNYARWIGNFTGGKVGEEASSGVGVTEQMGPFGI
ncbi:uncharacterized protein I303_100267 [Kwoniella dejecticola CBS 10117]|uniref:AttH domain-containing protein n=1 Tax=Kwoniella dejecticola CBS 10117 TaxID=1296121 RepID=A0A1A6AEE9_9TREE|nr:uncharacterized protein I303_00268 [Kwoniella dejecticola CBS 10117]OBR88451.1 hypothetical protein I303_00268 [Kwoniella dejecticola CBS 10117]